MTTDEELRDIRSQTKETLFQLATENPSSSRGIAARDELERRRTEPLVNAAKESAKAAKWAAWAAFASAITAILSLFIQLISF